MVNKQLMTGEQAP